LLPTHADRLADHARRSHSGSRACARSKQEGLRILSFATDLERTEIPPPEALRSLSPQLQSIASAIESAIRCSHLQPFLADGGVRGEILGTALEHDAALPHDVEPRPSVDAEPAEVFTFTARWIMRVSGEAECG